MTDFKPLFTWRSAITDSDLAPTTRLVALAMSLHMNERGGSCFPSAATTARETGLSISTVRDHRGILEDEGWLLCTERGGLAGEKRTASSYEATFPDPSASPTGTGTRPVRETARTPPSDRADPSVGRTLVLQESFIEGESSSRGHRRGKKTPRPDEFELTEERLGWVGAECPGLDPYAATQEWLTACDQNDLRYVRWEPAWKNAMRRAARWHLERGPSRTFL